MNIGYRKKAIIVDLEYHKVQAIKYRDVERESVTGSFIGMGKANTAQTKIIAVCFGVLPVVVPYTHGVMIGDKRFLITGISHRDKSIMNTYGKVKFETIIALQ